MVIILAHHGWPKWLSSDLTSIPLRQSFRCLMLHGLDNEPWSRSSLVISLNTPRVKGEWVTERRIELQDSSWARTYPFQQRMYYSVKRLADRTTLERKWSVCWRRNVIGAVTVELGDHQWHKAAYSKWAMVSWSCGPRTSLWSRGSRV